MMRNIHPEILISGQKIFSRAMPQGYAETMERHSAEILCAFSNICAWLDSISGALTVRPLVGSASWRKTLGSLGFLRNETELLQIGHLDESLLAVATLLLEDSDGALESIN